MYQKLLNISKQLGFIDFGAAKAEPLHAEAKAFEQYLSYGYNADMGYLNNNLQKRFDPTLLYEGAQSVLMFLAPYSAQNPHSGIASFAYGKDYHKVIKDKLYQFIAEAGIEGRPFVDSAPILERVWGVKAGLGFIGENHFLISPEFGTHTLLGCILTTLPFSEIDSPDLRLKKAKMPLDCGSCGRCKSACPTGAISNNGFLDARKCITYCTIESKELFENHPVDYHGSFFGCDRCQNACPWSTLSSQKGWEEFECNKEKIEALSREDWLKMSGEEFNNQFKDSPLSRPSLEKLKNNINFA